MKEKHQKLSVFISLILRHKPEVIDIQLDNFGYAKVNELIERINKHGKYKIDITILEQIVDTDSKMRYSFNKGKTKIRANQGHSIDVDLKLEEVVPPNILWHGTSIQNIDGIKYNGLDKRNRQFVHLSENRELAYQVGSRHGSPIVPIDEIEDCTLIFDVVIVELQDKLAFLDSNFYTLDKMFDYKQFRKRHDKEILWTEDVYKMELTHVEKNIYISCHTLIEQYIHQLKEDVKKLDRVINECQKIIAEYF